MRVVLGAFEEISAAFHAFDFSERAGEMFDQRKRNKKLQGPIDRVRNLRVD